VEKFKAHSSKLIISMTVFREGMYNSYTENLSVLWKIFKTTVSKLLCSEVISSKAILLIRLQYTNLYIQNLSDLWHQFEARF